MKPLIDQSLSQILLGIKSEKETSQLAADRSVVVKLCGYVHHYYLIWLQQHKGTSHKRYMTCSGVTGKTSPVTSDWFQIVQTNSVCYNYHVVCIPLSKP